MFDSALTNCAPTNRNEIISALIEIPLRKDGERVAVDELVRRLRGRKEIELLYS